MPNLIDGSVWIEDADYVGALDMHGILIRAAGEIDDGVGGALMFRDTNDCCDQEACDCCELGVTAIDLLAVIDRANLDPVRVAARKLVDQIEKWKQAKPGFDDDEVVEIGSLEPELSALKDLL